DGEAEAVLVTEQDRLSRLDEIPWAILKQTFRDYSIKLYTLSGEVDFGNEDDEFTADIMAIIDRRRRKTVVRQMVRGRAAAAKRGEWLGRLPFGYRRNPDTQHLEPHSAEAPLVREIFNLFAQGKMGSRRIAVVTSDRIPNKYVDGGFIVHVLRNPVYAGDIVTEVGGEQIRVDAAHEPIVGRDLWEACNRVLNARSTQNKKSRLESTVGLAAGIVYCSACGHLLSPTTAVKRGAATIHRYHYYRHVRGHRNASLPDGSQCRAAHRTETIDAHVREQLVRIATSPTARRQLIRQAGDRKIAKQLETKRSELSEQLGSLKRKQERLLQLFLSGDWDRSRLNTEKRRLETSIAALEGEIRDVEARLRLTKSDAISMDLIAETFTVAAEFESMPFSEQQAALRGLVERIEVDSDGRVTVTAKFPVAGPDTGSKKFAHHRVRAG
ncbi:MAG: recombinase family protein, partial [Thermaerobacter sp.]|nr:recombinase family protein [Thermaerobacter sp.]